MKQCSKCLQQKEENKFYNQVFKGKAYKRKICMSCYSVYQKTYREKNKESTQKIYVIENKDSELKELSKTSLFKNHTKENILTQSYPIILNPVPENWLYDLRIKEVESKHIKNKI